MSATTLRRSIAIGRSSERLSDPRLTHSFSFDRARWPALGVWTLLVASVCGPVSASAFQLQRAAFSSSAIRIEDGNVVLSGTLGEAGMVGSTGDANYRLRIGFWIPVAGAPSTEAPALIGVPSFVNAVLPAAPNPFRNATSIRFSVASRQPVRLTVFDVAGRRVHTLLDEPKDAGQYAVRWDGRSGEGRSVASGVYFYRLDIGSFTATRKVLRLN